MEEVSDWIDVCALDDIPADGTRGKSVKVGRKHVALFRVGDEVYAVHDYCPHQGTPLYDGMVEGTTVTCSAHQWRFSLIDGTCNVGEECNIMTWDVKVDGDRVLLSRLPRM